MRVYSKRNNETQNFGTISIDITPLPWNCDKIQYCVSQINFSADYFIATSDDYIEMEYYPVMSVIRKKYYFEDLVDIDVNNIADYLQNQIFKGEFLVTKASSGMLKIVNANNDYFRLFDITRRARWFTGFTQPIDTTYMIKEISCDQHPSTTFGNLLYLTSLQGETISTTTADNIPITPSIIYRINQFMRPGLPVIINKKQSKIITNPVSKIDITLTDIYLEPIILLSRLYVAVEVKPFKRRK
jgi:hypothetical protein